MDHSSKQKQQQQQARHQQQQPQSVVSMKHEQNSSIQQSLTSPSQLHFFQTTPQSSSSLPLPWMLPPYQMMVLPQGMSQSFLAQNMITLQDGHVVVAPSMDETNGGTQQMMTEEAAEAIIRQHQQQQQQQQRIAEQPTAAAHSSHYHHSTGTAQQQQHTMQAAHGQQSGAAQGVQGYRYAAATSPARATPAAASITPTTETLAQPKKPLTPYMMFSKSIWPQVKAANSHLSSVCEIGAIVGALWRDLHPIEKQKYNELFTQDKERYDTELRNYLKTTGLHASDLVKVKAKRKDIKSPTSTPARSHLPSGQQLARTMMAGQTASAAAGGSGDQANFTQAWTPQQQQLLAQMGLTGAVKGADGQIFVNADAASVANLLTSVATSQWTQSGASSNGPGGDSTASGTGLKSTEDLNRETRLEAEVIHLRSALSEKTVETMRLSSQLEEALHTIELYKQQCQLQNDENQAAMEGVAVVAAEGDEQAEQQEQLLDRPSGEGEEFDSVSGVTIAQPADREQSESASEQPTESVIQGAGENCATEEESGEQQQQAGEMEQLEMPQLELENMEMPKLDTTTEEEEPVDEANVAGDVVIGEPCVGLSGEGFEDGEERGMEEGAVLAAATDDEAQIRCAGDDAPSLIAYEREEERLVPETELAEGEEEGGRIGGSNAFPQPGLEPDDEIFKPIRGTTEDDEVGNVSDEFKSHSNTDLELQSA